MAQVQAPPRDEQTSRSCTGLGMRRIRWVRVVLTEHGDAVCHVMGTGHRLPTVRRLPLAMALSLAAQGVPCVVRSAPRATGVPSSVA